jgi:ribosomal protein S18 acetylase RimI-like enzyme
MTEKFIQTRFENKENLDIKIEIAKPEEWEDFKKIRLEAINKEPMAFWVTKDTEEKENAKSEEDWKKELMSHDKFVVLAKGNNIPVGMAQAILKTKEGDRWGVRSVYLNKNFRGSGSGEKMMILILDEIKKRGGKKVYFNVMDTQDVARKIYEKLGFKAYKEFESEIIDGIEYPGGQWMKKEI